MKVKIVFDGQSDVIDEIMNSSDNQQRHAMMVDFWAKCGITDTLFESKMNKLIAENEYRCGHDGYCCGYYILDAKIRCLRATHIFQCAVFYSKVVELEGTLPMLIIPMSISNKLRLGSPKSIPEELRDLRGSAVIYDEVARLSDVILVGEYENASSFCRVECLPAQENEPAKAVKMIFNLHGSSLASVLDLYRTVRDPDPENRLKPKTALAN